MELDETSAIKCGSFEKQSSIFMKWVERYWILNETGLHYYTCKNGQYKGTILLRDIISIKEEEYGYEKYNTAQMIRPNNKISWFSFSTNESLQEWISAINDVKSEYIIKNTNSILTNTFLKNYKYQLNTDIIYLVNQNPEFKSKKQLSDFLHNLYFVIDKLSNNEKPIQYPLVQTIIDNYRNQYPHLFDKVIEDHVYSIYEDFDDSDDEDADDNNIISEFSTPPIVDITTLYDIIPKPISKGGYGRVFKAFSKKTFEQVAIKVLSKQRYITNRQKLELYKEVSIMNRLKRHPNIIHFIAFYQDEHYFFIVQELAEGGQLFNAIPNRIGFSEKDCQKLLRILISTIAYIHQKNLVHRDLKPQNILLGKKGDIFDIKLCDFGFSTECGNEQVLNGVMGTGGYMAPELLCGHSYGKPVDMWALGVITYILLSGTPPFALNNHESARDKVIAGDYSLNYKEFENVSEEAKEFVRRLLEIDPQKRATAQQCINSAWLKYDSSRTMFMNAAVRKLSELNIKHFKDDVVEYGMNSTQQDSTFVYKCVADVPLRTVCFLNQTPFTSLLSGCRFICSQVIHSQVGTWVQLSSQSVYEYCEPVTIQKNIYTSIQKTDRFAYSHSIHNLLNSSTHEQSNSLFSNRIKLYNDENTTKSTLSNENNRDINMNEDHKNTYSMYPRAVWALIEARDEEPLAIPLEVLYVKLDSPDNSSFFNVYLTQTKTSLILGHIPCGTKIIISRILRNEEGTWIQLHSQILHAYHIHSEKAFILSPLSAKDLQSLINE